MKLNLLPMMGVLTPVSYLSSPLGFFPGLPVVFGDSMKNRVDEIETEIETLKEQKEAFTNNLGGKDRETEN